MKVILLERVGRMGQIGDEVTVKDGFARNFLLPQHKALRATDANRTRFARDRVDIEKRNTERREQAAGIAEGLNGRTVVMVRQAGETGQLYGSVSSRDIAEALATDGFSVQRGQVTLATPIKNVGIHSVALNLHAEVAVTVNVNVARSEAEAERQAKGEDLSRADYGDDRAERDAVFATPVGEDDVSVSDATPEPDGEMGEEMERQRDA